MSSDQVAKLAATIEVLTGAVHFLLAERVTAQPEAVRGDLLHILQRAFSTPPRTDDAFMGRAALAQADLALWMPIVASGMVDEVRRQIGREPEGVLHISQGRPAQIHAAQGQPDQVQPTQIHPVQIHAAQNRSAETSEVPERAVREQARAAVAHFEGGRAVG